MWVSTLLDVCRLMGNYPISYINIAYKAAESGYPRGKLRRAVVYLQRVALLA